MTTVTIVVVAILTCLIFALAIISFSSFIRSERKMIAAGGKDEEIVKEEIKDKKKSSKILNILSIAFSLVLMAGVATMAGVGIAFNASGEQFSVKSKTQLVIASNSMDGFWSEEYKITLPETAYKQQFAIGAICTFEKVSEDEPLELYQVYGYKLDNGKIITHRLIGYSPSGLLTFRGDNTGGRDNYVKREQVILRYTEEKINNIGLFVLFAQSGFGIYSLVSVIGVFVISEIFMIKYKKMVKTRLNEMEFDCAKIIDEPASVAFHPCLNETKIEETEDKKDEE